MQRPAPLHGRDQDETAGRSRPHLRSHRCLRELDVCLALLATRGSKSHTRVTTVHVQVDISPHTRTRLCTLLQSSRVPSWGCAHARQSLDIDTFPCSSCEHTRVLF